jgi:hypothetical protein
MKLRAIIALSSAALLTLVFALSSVAGPAPCPVGGDPDGDGICDAQGADNCTAVANAGQRDDDEDGYGNICDWDLNQDCVGGAPDLTIAFANGFLAAPWVPKAEGAYDVDENGTVGASDLTIIFANGFIPPGPSSRACADCAAAVGTGVCP